MATGESRGALEIALSSGDDRALGGGEGDAVITDPRLSAWASFYVVVGSAAGALVAIQFVVIALFAQLRRRASPDAIDAFATPTVVHFGTVLLVSAVMSAPLPSLVCLSAALAACGLGGLVHAALTILRTRRQTIYEPGWDDWFWYVILPSIAYAALGLAALFLGPATRSAPLVIGAATLGLLLLGVHNAWDTLTHLVVAEPDAGATGADRPTDRKE
jgi:hypothetical protein